MKNEDEKENKKRLDTCFFTKYLAGKINYVLCQFTIVVNFGSAMVRRLHFAN